MNPSPKSASTPAAQGRGGAEHGVSLRGTLFRMSAGHGMQRSDAQRPFDGQPVFTTPAEMAADPMKDHT
jgi:hypothetical protein